MPQTSARGPTRRIPTFALAGAMAGACLGAPRIASAVDATGVFTASGFLGFDHLSVRQEGSSLSVCVLLGDTIGKLMEGTIDSATGAFDLELARQVFGGGVAFCSLTLSGTFAPDGSTFSAAFEEHTTCVPPPFTCQPQCLLTGSGPVTGTRTSTTPAPCCGDGEPNPGEQCDDGNVSNSDCCSEVCQFFSAGTPCPSDPDPCTLDQCDGAGSCTHSTIPLCTTTTSTTTTTTATLPSTGCAPAPLPGCRLPTGPATVKLQLKDKSPIMGDRLTWKWTRGADTLLGEFGNPGATTDYALCLYEGFSFPFTGVRAPAGGTCGAKPCWKAGQTRFTYRDPERTPDGVARLVLLAGPEGKAKLALTAKGDNLPLPALGGLDLPLVAQLQGNGGCWQATFFADLSPAPGVFRAEAN